MNFRIFIAVTTSVFVASANTACAQSQTPFDGPTVTRLASPRVTVPLTREGEFYFADVIVNGKPFKFTLETGASFIGISSSAAKSLGLTVDSVDFSSRIGGPAAKTPVATIDSLSIGGVTYSGIAARISSMWDGEGFDGIISLPFFKSLLATIDLAHSQLTLERGALPAPNGRDILPIAGADQARRVDVAMSFGDVTVPIVIDTRSFVPISLPDSQQARLKFQSDPVAFGQAAGPSLGAFEMRAASLSDNARIGTAVFRKPPVILRTRGGPVIGVPALEHLVITIDQTNKRVRIVSADKGVIDLPAMTMRSGKSSEPSIPSPVVPAGQSGRRTMGFNMAGFPGTNQLRLVNLVPGSDADKVGLKNDDILVEFDGVAAGDMNPGVFRAAIARGTPVKMVVMREGKRLDFVVKPYRAQ